MKKYVSIYKEASKSNIKDLLLFLSKKKSLVKKGYINLDYIEKLLTDFDINIKLYWKVLTNEYFLLNYGSWYYNYNKESNTFVTKDKFQELLDRMLKELKVKQIDLKNPNIKKPIVINANYVFESKKGFSKDKSPMRYLTYLDKEYPYLKGSQNISKFFITTSKGYGWNREGFLHFGMRTNVISFLKFLKEIKELNTNDNSILKMEFLKDKEGWVNVNLDEVLYDNKKYGIQEFVSMFTK